MNQATAVVAAVAAAISNPPAIGEIWPGQGGIYLGVFRAGEGRPDYHLVLSPTDIGDFDELTFGPYGKAIAGAADHRDGQANTRELLNSSEEVPAAKACADLEYEGHQDYYLPSRMECAFMYAQAPDKALLPEWHWTSTQGSPHNAWVSYFNVGDQHYYGKDDYYRVRAVRRIAIQ